MGAGPAFFAAAIVVYAALHVAIALPLHLMLPPAARAAANAMVTSGRPETGEVMIFSLIAAILTLAAGTGAAFIVHLLAMLEAFGATPAGAVALGMLFGPAQVASRLVERLFGERYHPLWTALASAGLMAAGLAAMGAGPAFFAAAIVVYAAGYGISWVMRGTLPLVLFGGARYPPLAGRLAFPSLIAQALAPAAAALLIERHGFGVTLAVLAVLAAVNVTLVVWLWRLCAGRGTR
jgi:hypothetical protein